MTTSYRSNPIQSIYAVVNYNDAGIDAGVAIGSIPITAKILRTTIHVVTAFNAGASNSLSIGISAGGIELATTAETNCSVAGTKEAAAAFNLNPLAANRTIYTRYQQSGAAATAGKAYIVIEWSY